MFFRYIKRLCSLAVILIGLTGMAQPALAAEEKLAIVPFTVNAAKDLSFLQRGISTMLGSRLARPGKVAVMDTAAVAREAGKAPLDDRTARELGRRLGADYVLFGSLTVLGGSVSIDSRVLKVASDQPAMSFFSQADGMEKVIPKIDQLAAEINRRVFGTAPASAAPAARQPAAAPQAQEGLTMGTHPEKLMQQEGFGGNTNEGTATPFIMTGGSGSTYRGFWKSANYKVLFNGMALGDVDNDGLIETVVITPDEVIVYRGQDRKFFKAHQLPKADDNVFIGVDVADINDNGTPEIFVTSLNRQRNALASRVYEWDGKNFKPIVTGAPWYFRVADLPDRGPVLYGQKRGRDGVFGGAVYEMIWQGGEYRPQTRLKLSGAINLIGFSAGVEAVTPVQGTVIKKTEEAHKKKMEKAHKARKHTQKKSVKFIAWKGNRLSTTAGTFLIGKTVEVVDKAKTREKKNGFGGTAPTVKLIYKNRRLVKVIID